MNDFWGNKPFVQRGAVFVLRTPRAGSESLNEQIRQAIWSLNSDLPLARVRTMEDVYRASMARSSFTLVMLAIAGGMALLLGIVGIYGVISYSVSQRTRELGIRIALGAPHLALRSMVVRQGVVLAAIGVGFGLAAAAGLTRLMTTLLFQISPVDPLTYAAVAVGLLAAAAAGQLPAGVPRVHGGPDGSAARGVAPAKPIRLSSNCVEGAVADEHRQSVLPCLGRDPTSPSTHSGRGSLGPALAGRIPPSMIRSMRAAAGLARRNGAWEFPASSPFRRIVPD